jgi:hypothetical protein
MPRQGGGEFPQCLPTIGGAHQRILSSEVGQFLHFLAYPQRLGPAYGIVDGFELVGITCLRHGERLDGAVE